jgi:hypothetical protein
MQQTGIERKSARPGEVLMATCQMLARLKASGLSRDRSVGVALGDSRAGSNAAHSSKCVSASSTAVLSGRS